MLKTATELQEKNLWVLSSIEGTAVFMRKDSPHYHPKPLDRIVSEDCVLANESRLTEVTTDLNLPSEWGVFALTH